MSEEEPRRETTRRRFAGATAVIALGSVGGCLQSNGTAAAGGRADEDRSTPSETPPVADASVLGGTLARVDNFDGEIVDARGRDRVRVAVGAPGNGGNFAFDPPAVHVDRGTTLVWEWTGEGGAHNVVSRGHEPLESGDPTPSADVTYRHTFESDGVYPYGCVPHLTVGMAGAVVVGDDYEPLPSTPTTTARPHGPLDDGARADPPVFGGYLIHTNNFDGEIAGRRGRDAVTIAVGASGNAGNFAFDPPAVHVDRGTTVRWEWTGEGGGHDVVSPGGEPLDSGDLFVDPGVHYEHTFDADGVYRYRCRPHEAIGMRGGVVVGDDYAPVTPSPTAGPTSTHAPRSDVVPDTADRTFDGWLDETVPYHGVVDRTGAPSVTVAVGARGNGGGFAFDPPAVRVDAGTTVRWEWTGDGGAHDVVSPDGEPLASGEPVSESGVRYEHDFASTGVYRYRCRPHEHLGMRGVVEVV